MVVSRCRFLAIEFKNMSVDEIEVRLQQFERQIRREEKASNKEEGDGCR